MCPRAADWTRTGGSAEDRSLSHGSQFSDVPVPLDGELMDFQGAAWFAGGLVTRRW